MDADEARDRMQEIQRIMERATLFTLLPGTAAVAGGLLVLAGCAASYAMFRSLDFADMLGISLGAQAAFCVMWFAIGVLGVLLEAVLTTRAAKRLGLVAPDRPARLAALSLTPSVAVAMVLTVKFLIPLEPRPEEVQYIVPVWMMLYGTGVYTAGLFSIRAPRVLGVAFILMGIVALLFFPGYGVVSAALSFGLLHVVFGLYVVHKQRQIAAP
ncbi:MAG: hypothetical protein HUU20_24060 [Pirellulales bacterium]|nr:hypothetical protein [Pirellulales bacterium]